MPFIAQVAVGRRDKLTVYGSDYDTVDGTGVRDYLHVMDLAIGHVLALNVLLDPKFHGVKVYNLGTGKGNFIQICIKQPAKSCNIVCCFFLYRFPSSHENMYHSSIAMVICVFDVC